MQRLSSKNLAMEEHAEKIYRFELPIPFPVGTMNVYLIDHEPLTLVDTGVKTDLCLHALKDFLSRLGYGISDIKRILITHGHIDHYGQAQTISALSGAEIHMHREEYQRIHSIQEFWQNLRVVLFQSGTPEDCIDEAISYMRSTTRFLADPPDHVCFIDEGDEIPFEPMALRCLHCPGHSPGLICFYLEREGILMSGDHLLPEISPNPVIDLSEDGPGPRSRSLEKYLDSVRRLEGLGASLVLPGHGEAIRDLGACIQSVFEHHEQRLLVVRSVVARGEKTAYEIATALFPHARSFEAFLGVSEILGHLRILVDRGEVAFSSRDGIDYYSRA